MNTQWRDQRDLEKRATRLVPNPDGARRIATKLGRRQKYGAALARATLIVERLAQGDLEPFTCSRCGRTAFDPCGWDGPRKPLCEACSLPESPSDWPERRTP